MQEIWKEIKDYEGLYEISSLGNVRSIGRWVNSKNGSKRFSPNKLLRPTKTRYARVPLCKNGIIKHFSVHRLVAQAFPEICGEWFEGAVINHKDCNTFNNKAENLEWCTQEHNINWADRNYKAGQKLSKKVYQFSKNGEFIKEWKSLSEIERELGYFTSYVSKCCNGFFDTAYGFVWKYE